MTEKMSLEDLRKKLTEVTLEIFRLCGERLRLVEEIAEIKAREKIPIENMKVEEELRNKVLHLCKTCDLDEDFCLRLLEILLDESKRVQREILRLKS